MARQLIVNTFMETECRVWCELTWSKDEELDLVLLPADLTLYDLEKEPEPPKKFSDFFQDLGPKSCLTIAPEPETYPKGPDWFKYDILEMGLRDLIQPDQDNYTDMTLDTWAVWALQEGIAPRQPFLLRIPKPRYHRDYEGEWDADYSWDILLKATVPDDKYLVKKWEAYLKSVGLEIPHAG